MKNKLIENIDYYLNENGLMVFTEKYHTERGHCCQSGCIHCPYEFSKKIDPNIPTELQNPWSEELEDLEVYEGPLED